jgi:hypothetical protein
VAPNASTSGHSCQPVPSETSTTNGWSSGITGGRATRNRCPGTPSDSPRNSPTIVSACTASTVPPMVNADAARIVGDAE